MYQLQSLQNGQWYVRGEYDTLKKAKTAYGVIVTECNDLWIFPPKMRIIVTA